MKLCCNKYTVSSAKKKQLIIKYTAILLNLPGKHNLR